MQLQKLVISTVLIVITLLNTMSNVAVISYFYSNQTYIAEAFCINKDNPELHCDGKCYLSQKLAALEQEQQQAMQNAPVEFNFIVFCSELDYQFLEPTTQQTIQYTNRTDLAVHQCIINSIFEPPEA